MALLGDSGGDAVPDGAVREKDIVFLIDQCAIRLMNVFCETGRIVAGNEKHGIALIKRGCAH